MALAPFPGAVEVLLWRNPDARRCRGAESAPTPARSVAPNAAAAGAVDAAVAGARGRRSDASWWQKDMFRIRWNLFSFLNFVWVVVVGLVFYFCVCPKVPKPWGIHHLFLQFVVPSCLRFRFYMFVCVVYNWFEAAHCNWQVAMLFSWFEFWATYFFENPLIETFSV